MRPVARREPRVSSYEGPWSLKAINGRADDRKLGWAPPNLPAQLTASRRWAEASHRANTGSKGTGAVLIFKEKH